MNLMKNINLKYFINFLIFLHISLIFYLPSTLSSKNLWNKYSHDFLSCPSEVIARYGEVYEGKGQKSLQWCQDTMKKYGTIIGKRWGPMSKELRDIWSESNCEELIQFQTLFSCNRRYGWEFFSYWLSKRIPPKITDGIECITSNKANRLCHYINATVNFDKVKRKSVREYSSGFLESHGTTSAGKEGGPVPGYQHIRTSSLSPQDIGECNSWEYRPTIFLSNDDPWNLSHYMNDVIMIWSLLVLGGLNSHDVLLINMDGIRTGGPAGGPPNRIIKPSSPDDHGPFVAYFQSWFNEIKKGVDYDNSQRVCFKDVYFQYFPGYSWFWNDWSMDNSCTYRGPSPLYQSFSLFFRYNWIQQYGLDSLPSPPIDHIHIVFELREINQHKRESFPRYIQNSQEIITALTQLPNVKVTSKSFSKLPFPEQIAITHSANIFISMHGAGTANMFHTAIGKPNCCVLIELFPDKLSSHFYTIRGFGNLARHYGMHYYRYDTPDGDTNAQGTMIRVSKFMEIIEQAMKALKVKPTCLNNATHKTIEQFHDKFPLPLSHFPEKKKT